MNTSRPATTNAATTNAAPTNAAPTKGGRGTSEPPADIPAAIARTKAQLRQRIGDLSRVFGEVEEAMRAEVAAVVAAREEGEQVWPVVEYADIAAGRVPDELRAAVRKRGCAVVRGTFDRRRAEEWDRQLVAYVEANDFAGTYRRIDDGVFGNLDAGVPPIFPIYWSRPQLEAREDPHMVAVRQFLNGFWRHESQGRVWFDPSRDTAYPDRVRRRPPGTTSGGLSAHTDSGSVERWLLPAYQTSSGTSSTATGGRTTRGTAPTAPTSTSSRRR